MSELTIWGQLVNDGLSPCGAAGLMGNMDAESAMRANNAQDGMTSMSDADYTDAVDIGSYDRFVNDAVGYGLIQWTYWSRKAALLAFARERGASIGDEAMQVAFCLQELRQDYRDLYNYLCRTDDYYEAASRVCTQYERPAVNNISVRAISAKKYLDRFGGTAAVLPETDQSAEPNEASVKWRANVPTMATLCQGFGGTQVTLLQRLLLSWGYTVTVTGIFDAETDTAVRAFQADNNLESDGIVGRMTWTALLAG